MLSSFIAVIVIRAAAVAVLHIHVTVVSPRAHTATTTVGA